MAGRALWAPCGPCGPSVWALREPGSLWTLQRLAGPFEVFFQAPSWFFQAPLGLFLGLGGFKAPLGLFFLSEGDLQASCGICKPPLCLFLAWVGLEAPWGPPFLCWGGLVGPLGALEELGGGLTFFGVRRGCVLAIGCGFCGWR